VDLPAILPVPEAKVRPGSQARAADVSDHLPLLDRHTRTDPLRDARHVQVLRRVGRIVADFHVVAVPTCISGFQNDAISHRMNGCARIGGIVRAEMGLVSLLDGMEATLGVAGADPLVFQGGLEKSLPQRVALFIIEIGPLSLVEIKAQIVLASMLEPRRENPPDSDRLAIDGFLFVDDREGVPLLDPEEIDLPGEDLRKLSRENGNERWCQFLATERLIQGAVNLPFQALALYGNLAGALVDSCGVGQVEDHEIHCILL